MKSENLFNNYNELNLSGKLLVVQTVAGNEHLHIDPLTGIGTTGIWTIGANHTFSHVVLRVQEDHIWRVYVARFVGMETVAGRKSRGNNRRVNFRDCVSRGVSTVTLSEFCRTLTTKGAWVIENDLLIREEDDEFSASLPEEKREGKDTTVKSRPMQREFSQQVFKNCGGVCLVTGSKIQARCEAAHIVPHKDEGVDHYSNGLWLRHDIHALFDAFLCGIDPETLTIHFCKNTMKHDRDLAVLDQKPLGKTVYPMSKGCLSEHWKIFTRRQMVEES